MKSFKPAFAVALTFFLLGIVAGIMYPGEWILKTLKEGAGVELSFKYIYLHNLKALGLIYLASIVYVGLVLVLANGYALGTAIVLALNKGLTPLQVAAAIVPHGIFELPALLAASATGLVTIGYVKSRRLRGLAVIVTLLVIEVTLLAIAAFIEAYITPVIMKLFGVSVGPMG